MAPAFWARRSISRTRLQVTVENGAVVASQFALELFGAVQDQIQNAVGLTADECALLRRVAFTEQLQEDFARIVFHRQRRLGIAERESGVGAATAGCALNGGFRCKFQRGKRRVSWPMTFAIT